MDVNEGTNHECSECMMYHLNISDWFTRSHPSKEENRTRNRNTKFKCKKGLGTRDGFRRKWKYKIFNPFTPRVLMSFSSAILPGMLRARMCRSLIPAQIRDQIKDGY